MTSHRRRQSLIKNGLKEEKCEVCKNEMWNGLSIPLELHHVDGNPKNNEIENLQILCPNCHAQTENFKGKNKGKNRKKGAKFDGAEVILLIPKSFSVRDVLLKAGLSPSQFNYDQVYKVLDENPEIKFLERFISPKRNSKSGLASFPEGSLCFSQTKTSWPSDEELKEIVWIESLSSLARKLGVSPNAVKHRCYHRNIPTPPVGYWRKIAVGKLEECQIIKQQILKK